MASKTPLVFDAEPGEGNRTPASPGLANPARASQEAAAPLYPDLDLDKSGSTKSYWWVWAILLLLIGYGCYRLYTFENAKKAAVGAVGAALQKQRVVTVVTSQAREGNLPVYLEGLGSVAAFNTVTVRPRIDGQLVSVTFQEGQFVHKGDVLGQIDSRPFQVALAQAQGALAEAHGTLSKDQAALRNADANTRRSQELFKDQIIAKQELDAEVATGEETRGSIAADQAGITAAQASVDAAQLNLTYTKIVAPISGRIGLRLLDSGNMIHATDVTGLAVITQLQPIAVLFTVPEDQLPPILRKLAAGAKLRVEAYGRDQKQKLADGTLLTVDNQIDATTGTSRLKAVFDNSDLALFPNQFVNARLWLDTRRDVTIIPAVAIQRGPTGTFVYLLQKDGTAGVRMVKVGMSQGDNVSVEDGLAPGDMVVTDGAEKLTDGMKVAVAQTSAGSRRAQQE